MNSLRYAGLVGKYVRMERAATDEEKEQYQTDTVGMEGVVTRVLDTQNGVLICSDYGIGYEIYSEHEPYWTFDIWSSEAEAKGKYR